MNLAWWSHWGNVGAQTCTHAVYHTGSQRSHAVCHGVCGGPSAKSLLWNGDAVAPEPSMEEVLMSMV
jgi:hypothetical protein